MTHIALQESGAVPVLGVFFMAGCRDDLRLDFIHRASRQTDRERAQETSPRNARALRVMHVATRG
ncbi:hypothetical protein WG70_30325 [Burkholderia oklahomensis EO147]|nr:hypothetical protein WG70_30325 [Burkholderia oklahomensis EO147]